MNALLSGFKQLEVRDLLAMMEAPGLLSSWRGEVITDEECHEEIRTRLALLKALEQESSPLVEWLGSQTSSHLLGRYFEALVGYWIRELMGVRRLETGLKISRAKLVLGEMDFVFEYPSNVIQHWEVSVKFYLCTAPTLEGGTQARSFVGTMTRDRLDLKIAKLFNQQIRLPELPEASEKLAELGFAQPAFSRVLLKGALFYPAERDWRRHPHPPEVSKNHLRGWWSTVLPADASEKHRWVVLDKRRWLAPYLAQVGEIGKARDPAPLNRLEMQTYLTSQFENNRTAFMLAQVQRSGDYWNETERGLVVHPGWPLTCSTSFATG